VRYAAVRQSLGEPDPFRLRYRDSLREVVEAVILGRMDMNRAAALVSAWTQENIDLEITSSSATTPSVNS
jgi:hypothetical protein